MADGFLGRWSRRKLDVEAGKPVPLDPPPSPPPPPSPLSPPPAAVAHAAPAPAHPPEPSAPAPTLEDVAELTPESDFSRFANASVNPEVKNAALKKLFADPHFNVMDGLDIYIDDYGLPDPIPEKMLRSLVSAQALGLFREDPPEPQGQAAPGAEDEAAPGENPARPLEAPQSVAQWPPAPEPSPAAPHADPDLRLQQDHAPGPEGPGDGAR